MNKPYLDPFARGFLEHEDLTVAERIGYGVIEVAKYTEIDFPAYLLPHVTIRPKYSSSWFFFADSVSVWYEPERIAQLLPDEEDRAYIKSNFDRIIEFRSDNFVERAIRPFGQPLVDAGACWGGGWGGHCNPDFGKLAAVGTDGMRAYIDSCEEKNPGAKAFYNASRMFLDALDIFGERFRALAEKRAAECDDPELKEKYLRAEKAFHTIPRKPATDFHEAVLCFWLHFTFDGIDSPGRLDQYLYPFYLKSSAEERHEMLSRLWDAFHATRTWNLCISGSDENWNDMTNELSYDILAMCREKKYQTPNLTMRVHRNTPEKLWKETAQTLALGMGIPAIYNDECVCPALEKIGIPPCDSHLYCLNGCNQIDIMAKSHMGLEDGEVNFAKVVDLTLWNGTDSMTGKELTIKTGDPAAFTTFEQFKTAFYRQLDYLTYQSTLLSNLSQQALATYGPNPFRSMFIEGCLEKGVDYNNGGPLYNHGQVLAEGMADAADSLRAVQKLVFEDKKYSMQQLCDAIRADFVGYETLLHDFSHCEKFGNDCDAVDSIGAEITEHFFAKLKTFRTYRGGIYTGGCSPYDRAANYGRKVGALPSGKRRGEPMLADSIGAVPGQDKNGPTAALRSALRYPHIEAGSGFILNVKFDKRLFGTEKGQESFIALTKAYFAGGGQQMTATVVNREELLDAKVNPDKHGDLIVRVGGFSDYFVALTDDLKENVIARTDHTV